ncbi:MAG: HypC/HybG/HupF family hydrogenase formation chaperone [Nitrospirae bacterium]|nr:HypC/HybG/HupF family hydrogenase formation chaperone [Nitrospirota bacterium]MBF0536527.1 HypC/HybG/HupF family hydrogenase formation chaperone [Nitrospirota bacterium]MBF0616614.1 HypC/HybG/HupF family hydrogenase formation chaperone [Nitrospirota bacterium]
MCLAVPSKIVSINNHLSVVDVMGVRREISLLLMPEEVSVGDYVLIHAGFAIQRVDETAAMETLRFFKEAGALSALTQG